MLSFMMWLGPFHRLPPHFFVSSCSSTVVRPPNIPYTVLRIECKNSGYVSINVRSCVPCVEGLNGAKFKRSSDTATTQEHIKFGRNLSFSCLKFIKVATYPDSSIHESW